MTSGALWVTRVKWAAPYDPETSWVDDEWI